MKRATGAPRARVQSLILLTLAVTISQLGCRPKDDDGAQLPRTPKPMALKSSLPRSSPSGAAVKGSVDYQAELPPSPGLTSGAHFKPPGKDEIPEGSFGEAVRRGRDLFIDTQTHAGDYVGNDLNCVNCHLNEGRQPGAGPLWAAWVSYPAYRKKNDKVNSMEERLEGCFTYSMNAPDSPKGTAPPMGDPIYLDLQAYMYWLATGAPTGVNMPGRAYGEVKAPSGGYDPLRGEAVYEASCQVCHGADGQGQSAEGQTVFPPLWGARAYNWGAGMHRINTAAAFIQSNMPLGQGGTLSDQEAWDVAAYINTKPHPADPREAGSTLAQTDARYHNHACAYGEKAGGKTLGSGTHL